MSTKHMSEQFEYKYFGKRINLTKEQVEEIYISVFTKQSKCKKYAVKDAMDNRVYSSNLNLTQMEQIEDSVILTEKLLKDLGKCNQ